MNIEITFYDDNNVGNSKFLDNLLHNIGKIDKIAKVEIDLENIKEID